MQKIKFFFFLFILLSTGFSSLLKAQEASFLSRPEELRYKVYFHWGFIWLHAGKVSFISEIKTDDPRSLHFISTGSTLKIYDLMFKVRDRFESMARIPDFTPMEFHRNTLEGKYHVEHSYRFDWDREELIVLTCGADGEEPSDTVKLKTGTRDVLTSVYFCRSIDYPSLEPGSRIPVVMVIDRVVYDLDLIYEGREIVKIEGHEKSLCYKISIQLEKGTLFKGGDTLTAWITADSDRIPLAVEASILIGSVKAILI